jgi:hypothetical protein
MTRSGMVYVGEDSGGDDLSVWSGRWSAHWEPSTGEAAPREGPRGVSASDAIAWSRAQADVVLIRPGDSTTLYSAGRRHRKNVPLWPEGQELPRRGDPHLAHRDRPATAPDIAWRVGHSLTLSTREISTLIESYGASLQDDADIEAVLQKIRLDEHGNAEGALTVRAATAADARAKALSATQRAWKTACDSVGAFEARWSYFIKNLSLSATVRLGTRARASRPTR